MPTFDTPRPVTVGLHLIAAHVRVSAGDHSTTTVDVVPTNAADRADVRAAEQTTVELVGGTLEVKTGKQWRVTGPFGNGGSITVTIALPSGSDLNGSMAVGDLQAEGRLGDCRFRIAAGQIWLDEVGDAHLSTAAGDVTVNTVAGGLELKGAGRMRVGSVASKAAVRNINGSTWIGTATGHLRCSAANGDITIDRAGGSVAAKSANGNISIGEIGSGSVAIDTASGHLQIGIPEGTAAMLDVRTRFGSVTNELTAADAPSSSDRTVQVHARTAFGDIAIRRPAAVAS